MLVITIQTIAIIITALIKVENIFLKIQIQENMHKNSINFFF